MNWQMTNPQQDTPAGPPPPVNPRATYRVRSSKTSGKLKVKQMTRTVNYHLFPDHGFEPVPIVTQDDGSIVLKLRAFDGRGYTEIELIIEPAT